MYKAAPKGKANGGKPGARRATKASQLPDPVPFEPRVFRPTDERNEGKQYLEEHGYVVYGPILNQDEIQTAISLLWDYLEGLGTGIRRNDPSTWKDENWLPDGGKGILYSHHIGQSRFMWFLRGAPLVAEVFANLWNTTVEQLLTSFDGCCIMRPTSYNPNWLTQSGWYHVDQNGLKKPGLTCYQGQINLLPAGPDAPGLVVVPGSHNRFDAYFAEHPSAGQMMGRMKGDFVTIKPGPMVEFFNAHPIKVCSPPGSLIIWDSRTIHCNAPARAKFSLSTRDEVIPDRIVGYVCMMPRPAEFHKLMPLLKDRRRGVASGATTNHWANEYSPSRACPPRLAPSTPITYEYKDITPELNEHCKRLAGIDT